MIFVGAVMGEKIAKTMSWTVLVVPILALMEDHINTLQKVCKLIIFLALSFKQIAFPFAFEIDQ